MASIADFLRGQGIPFREGGQHKHVRPGWVGVDCPRCGPGSGKFHAGICVDLSRAVCWRCGRLRVFDLLGQLCGLTWYEVRELVQPGAVPSALPVVRGKVKVPRGLHTLTKPYRQYLKGRGFDPTVIEDLWGVRGTGNIGRLAWRLWIPIYDPTGQCVSWTTRAIGETDARYISASPDEESVNLKTLLYGEHLAEQAVIVVEGPVDVWAIGPGGVAILGLQTTPEQLARIGSHPVRAICCDSEPAAQRRAERIAATVRQYPGETYIVELETGKDVAAAEPEEIEELKKRFLRLR